MAGLILGKEDECYICGCRRGLERHHVYGSGRRKLSERYGACVMLCYECHRGKHSAHGTGGIADRLKQEAQIELMEKYGWTTEDFIKIFGRSYVYGIQSSNPDRETDG